MPAQSVERFKRRRQMGEGEPGEIRERHDAPRSLRPRT
jgi:hypothetical protein